MELANQSTDLERQDAYDSFWNGYNYITYQYFYYRKYQQFSIIFDRCFGWIAAITSSISVATWVLWDKHQLIWAGIIAAAQVAELIRPSFKHSKQLVVLDLFLPEAYELIVDMGIAWDLINEQSEPHQIVESLGSFQKKFNALEVKYIQSSEFPDRKLCQRSAIKERTDYMASRHISNRKKETEDDAEQQASITSTC